MKIEILCTGDEILSGKTVNTNHSHMAKRLQECGFTVYWGTTVGDDRASLEMAFMQASHRADIVIVNGGLGPTVDDLSQELAAQAAGVELELHEDWLRTISDWYESRGRSMPVNNTKQAMLPVGAEFIDNPVGTACGFAININAARFFFTPGVPMELKIMLEQQILPRLQHLRGNETLSLLKRFHTFGIGESRADHLLENIPGLEVDGAVKLGFQSHYPQLEIKLMIQGDNQDQMRRILLPIEQTVRERLGNGVVSEDEETLESEITTALRLKSGAVSVAETLTSGSVFSRLARVEGSAVGWGVSALSTEALARIVGSDAREGISAELAEDIAKRVKQKSGAEYGLSVLCEAADVGDGPGVRVVVGISDGVGSAVRFANLPGSTRWVVQGAIEMSLDCLRRYLLGLPVYERNDFEQH